MNKITKSKPELKKDFERLSGRSHGAGTYYGEGSRSGVDIDLFDKDPIGDGAGDINDDGEYEQVNGSFSTSFTAIKGIGNGVLNGSSYGGGLGEQQPKIPSIEKTKKLGDTAKLVVFVIMTIVFIQALLILFQNRGII